MLVLFSKNKDPALTLHKTVLFETTSIRYKDNLKQIF